MQIGLSLSGGGVRAAVFHLGVLKYIAEQKRLSDVKIISTVSGASLLLGLIFKKNNYRWVTEDEFFKLVPKIKYLFTNYDLEKLALKHLFFHPLKNKNIILSETIQKLWGIQEDLSSLPKYPKWIINATTYETGKRWSFTGEKMGDLVFGYTNSKDFPIANAIASSAGFPVLIGPLKLDTSKYIWEDGKNYENCSKLKRVNLWDGGIYDNLGVRPLFKNNKLVDIDYLIVSNASRPIDCIMRESGLSVKNLRRLLDIALSQVSVLHSTDILEFFQAMPNTGVYVMIGNTRDKIYKRFKSRKIDQFSLECLSPDEVAFVKYYKTSLEKIPARDFDLIMRHGYEVMKLTSYSYGII